MEMLSEDNGAPSMVKSRLPVLAKFMLGSEEELVTVTV